MKPVEITPAEAGDDPEAGPERQRQRQRRHLTAADWPKLTGTARRGTPAEVAAGKRPGAAPERPGEPLPDLLPLIRRQARRQLGPGRYLEGGFVARGHLGFVPHLARIDRDADWVAAILAASVLPWQGEVPAELRDQARFQAMVLGVDRILVIHLQLASWEEGQAMIEAGQVPAGRLETFKVEVPAAERDRIEHQAEHWWKRHVQGPPEPAGTAAPGGRTPAPRDT
jgi:hypothetical protein